MLQQKLYLTPQEYLAFEREAETKSEYYNGEIYAMAGATREHSLIVTNTVLSLGTRLRGRRCEIYAADMRVKVSPTGLYTYPDVVVVWVGVNDVWHKRSYGTGTDADKFERFYVALIQKMQARGIQVICATPAVVGERTDFTNELDGDLNRYAQIIRGVADHYNCAVADFRHEFLKYNLEHNPENKDAGILTSDGVHLNAFGNQLVADVFYRLLLQ